MVKNTRYLEKITQMSYGEALSDFVAITTTFNIEMLQETPNNEFLESVLDYQDALNLRMEHTTKNHKQMSKIIEVL